MIDMEGREMVTDDVLRAAVDALTEETVGAGLRRVRGGIARGVAWAEISGRMADQGWVEMRLHHRPNEQRLQAGMLLYQPLAQGGRTLVLGEWSGTYPGMETTTHVEDMVETAHRWLVALRDRVRV